MKLNQRQSGLLESISKMPGKSGQFWRDLGHPYQTLNALENKGLIRGDWSRPFARAYTVPWTITDKGREVLSLDRDPKSNEVGE